ncbi:hypothetical protein DFH28DRAFT_1200914, partial [Melampsora americana]
MDRPCDCHKCWTKHGASGPTVSSLTIRRHHQKNGPRPSASQPQPAAHSPQAFNQPSQPPTPEAPASQPPPIHSNEIVSSVHDEILKISLSNFKITPDPPSLGDRRTIPKDKGPSDGTWLFLCVALVTYLHVVAGVSVKAVNTTLRTLRLAFSQLTKGLNIHEEDQKLIRNFPLDVSTAMRWLDIEALLERSICCPKCFKRYRYPTADEPPIPQRCTRKETSRNSNHSVDYRTWTLRSHADHTQQAKAWRDAKTLKAREQIFGTCGVRWSCLNELDYWDPTKMVVVDTMHCISGMLEYHFRRVWDLIELGKALEKGKESRTSALLQEAISTDLDINMTDDWEPLQLDLDHAMGSDISSNLHPTSFNQHSRGFQLNHCTLTSLEEGLDEDENNVLYDDDGNEVFPEINSSSAAEKIQLLGTEGLKKIRSTISTTIIPSWISPPPTNLGSASHGKLRSADWIVLFTIHLPVAMFQLLHSSKIDPGVVSNVLHLCSLTEIVMSYHTSDQNIQKYFDHLVAYRSSLRLLRSDLKPTPNQHMAFHVPFQFYNYGPSAYLAAWQFEQYNGILQKIPNNRKIWELDLTMLRQLCRASNLAIALDSPDCPECAQGVSELLKGGKKLSSKIGEIPIDANQDAASSSNLQDMSDVLCSFTYTALLRRLGQLDETNRISISSRVKFLKRFSWHGLTITPYNISSRNCIIEYTPVGRSRSEETSHMGKILKIFNHVRNCTTTGQDIQDTFISVLRFQSLSESHQRNNPFKEWPNLKYNLFYTHPSNDRIQNELGLNQHMIPEVISLEQIMYPTASHTYPDGTFGIQPSTIAIKSLSRGRHTW